MPRINMIAPRRAEKLRRETTVHRLGMVFAGLVAATIVAGLLVSWSYFGKLGNIADLDAQISKLQPTVRQIDEFRAATEKLMPKLSLLNQAKDSTMQWYGLMDRLTESMPGSAFLTRIATNVEGGTDKTKPVSTVVSVSGTADSQSRVGDIMLRLQMIPELSGVELHFTTRSTSTVEDKVEFEIGAGFKAAEIKSEGAAAAVETNAQNPRGVK